MKRFSETYTRKIIERHNHMFNATKNMVQSSKAIQVSATTTPRAKELAEQIESLGILLMDELLIRIDPPALMKAHNCPEAENSNTD